MKLILVALLASLHGLAQLPKMPGLSDIKDMSKQVMELCKEDKSKISGCESYTDLSKLKTCLMTNESKLSEKCKKSLKLMK